MPVIIVKKLKKIHCDAENLQSQNMERISTGAKYAFGSSLCGPCKQELKYAITILLLIL